MKTINWYRRNNDIITLTLYVQPGAKKTEIVGSHGGALKIRVESPPIDGRANEVLLKYVAMLFKVPLRQVKLKQGDKSRHKVVVVTGSKIDPENTYSIKNSSEV